MLIWGGYDGTNYLDDGASYDPSGDTWAVLTAAPSGMERSNHTAVWAPSRNEMIIWGGADSAGAVNTGLLYDTSSGSWSQVTTTGAPSARYYHTAAWTGSGMLIWGGGGTGIFSDGAIYDPATDTWTASSAGASTTPSARYQHGWVWTGSALVVWSGYDGFGYLDDGGLYFP
jgi:hypothetical protein